MQFFFKLVARKGMNITSVAEAVSNLHRFFPRTKEELAESRHSIDGFVVEGSGASREERK